MADFERIAFLDEPPIAGAQWWQKSVQGELSRRTTLIALGLGGVALTAGCAALVADCTKDDAPESTENRAALDMQRRYGWSFGANGEILTLGNLAADFDPSTGAVQRQQLAALTLGSIDPALRPFQQAALLEVPTATPVEPAPADTSVMQPFVEAYVPVVEAGLGASFRTGIAIARLFARVPEACALMIDLPGAESVAVAAGAATWFAPVLVMPNWPHPRGVVRSHQALAALTVFQAYFSGATRKSGAPPAFVLDADRTLPLPAGEEKFDNRYRAAAPPAAAMKQLGIQHVFILRAVSAVADEAKDLHGRFAEWAAAGIGVHMLYGSDFFLRFVPSIAKPNANLPTPDAVRPARYAALGEPPSSFAGEADDYATFRATYFGGPGTAYGKGGSWKLAPPDPAETTRSIGMVPVVVAGGIILGAQMARQRDSWSRGFGGGGG